MVKKLWKAFRARVRFGWAEALMLVGLIIILRPLPVYMERLWRQVKWDWPIVRQLDERIPEAHQGSLKYMYGFIVYVNENIPEDERILFVGEMKHAIRVHYYTFPRVFEWISDKGEYHTVAERVQDDDMDWLIVNGARKVNLSAVMDQLELVYGKPDSHQRIYKVRSK